MHKQKQTTIIQLEYMKGGGIPCKAIGKQTEPFASVPGAIFWSFSQVVDSWQIPILLLLFMPRGT